MAEEPGGAPHQEEAAARPNIIPGVKHVVAVSSGKGGVGKSTVSSISRSPLRSPAQGRVCWMPISTVPNIPDDDGGSKNS